MQIATVTMILALTTYVYVFISDYNGKRQYLLGVNFLSQELTNISCWFDHSVPQT